MTRIKRHFPGENQAYRKHREKLLQAEIALKDQREKVAQLRRKLPLGGKVETDYKFREGPPDLNANSPDRFFDTRLSQLFKDGKDLLLIDHMMFGTDWDEGCPMCSMWADGFDAIVPHVQDRVNFVLVARVELGKLRDWGGRRGWRNLRLLSSEQNSFNKDYNVEIDASRQLPGLSVFRRQPAGGIFHVYTTEASLEERHHRGMDLFTPTWNLFDLLPEGRGDWMPKQFYT